MTLIPATSMQRSIWYLARLDRWVSIMPERKARRQNHMPKMSKRFKEIAKKVEAGQAYSITDAIEILKGCPAVKFDESFEIAIRMGVDPRKSDQNVRGTVSLPHGTGKKIRVLALVKGERVQEAIDAGAEFAGSDEFVDKIKGGWTDFDALVTTPDMMRDVGKLGKILGPRGLMPTPKAGTVTTEIGKAIADIQGGKVEFKLDRHGVISTAVGKLSFVVDKLNENIQALVDAIYRAKPSSAKGQYVRSVCVSSTMGPGLKIDPREIERA
ncbi:50S ribosomal protein L1 [Chlamydiales bacterium SCGC AG-110-P3]|nr:50S ribosomal protein L1 [Chlamydiales bacterium SCGC AG-110-P3]